MSNSNILYKMKIFIIHFIEAGVLYKTCQSRGIYLMRFRIVTSIAAGMATGLGALPMLIIRKISDVFIDLSLAFAAGVMLAAASSA